MADGKEWPKNKKALYSSCLFCVKYPAEHDLKSKGVQGADPPPEW